MTDAPTSYSVNYANSWALIIGIDKYKHASPLGYARSDAEGVAKVLRERFGFPLSNITLLTDNAATRQKIMSAFLKYVSDERIAPDDRIIVFFAGHGHTVTGHRGETGFLVPVDGRVDDLSTLVRWDELTRNADLIRAKHLLFLMDACYGGLALARKPVAPGSMRFLKDMLQRYSRQVLTAGKANEVVADSGGPRPGHSVFTGHLLNALEGGVGGTEKVLTANAVMAYVYDRVARDQHSRQTPHYGFLDGDGDFVFDTSPIDRLGKEESKDEDLLVSVAPYPLVPGSDNGSVTDTVKDLLAAPNQQIRLDDFISAHIRRFLNLTSLEEFPIQGGPAPAVDEFVTRLKRYEQAIGDLETMSILLARWAEPHQLPLLEKIFMHLGESEKGGSGYVLWADFGWYPCLLLMYAAGIAALSANRYDSLATSLATRIQPELHTGTTQKAIILLVDGLGHAADGFKWLPGHERHYVPKSEYLFKMLQPPLEDALFLGRRYELLFDRFEILFALVYCDLVNGDWGPIGRFGWKYRSLGGEGGPFKELVTEAAREGAAWGPLKAGLFGGKGERFLEVAIAFEKGLTQLPWF